MLLVYASTEVTKNVVFLPESAPESYEPTIKYVRGEKRAEVLILGKDMLRSISRWSLRLVWVIT